MTQSQILDTGTVEIYHGDCIDVMKELHERGITCSSIVTDPPYHLGKNGFMNKAWDAASNGIAFNPDTWRLAFNLLKPGGHLIAFGGTRTYHRLACAIEDAGFEIRDCIRSLNGQEHYPAWVYGSGFPKSLDIGKAIDKAAGAERKVIGTCARPDGSFRNPALGGAQGVALDGSADGTLNTNGAMSLLTAPATPDAQQWDGWGSSLKPAWEPVVLARKPLSEPTIAANVLKHGVGGLNIGACRIGTAEEAASSKRFPANLLHDGSDEVLAEFARFGERKAAYSSASGAKAKMAEQKSCNGSFNTYSIGLATKPCGNLHCDTGTAARFFYAAKASKLDRMGTTHPTTKPVSLIEYLAKLITPPSGTILDPFAGSGTLAVAASRLGFNAILIEREAGYIEMIHKRLAALAAASQPARQGGLFDEQDAAE